MRVVSRSVGWFLLLLSPGMAVTGAAAQTGAIPSIEEKTEGMARMEGFFDIYWDASTGRLYWEIDKWDTEFLYQIALSSGLGSNPVGLDRGQLGGTYILKTRRVGPKILLFEPNYRYRARSDNVDEVEAVRDAFAPSIHWGFEVVAQTDQRVLVDATDFFLRDAHGVVRALARSDQGSYQLDKSRSVFHLPRTKAFPLNTEIETLLTFVTSDPGSLVESVAASGEAVSLRQHHSLVQLPDDDYRPREADPRIGVSGPAFYDYATPIDEHLVVRWVARHRLEKRNPRAERSEPVQPIIYYVDPGAPEPIRTALMEGASWWNEAFEAAGFIDAFRVEVLPDGADPLDLRYNVIHWTHRSTRGWSYGGSVVDPRTGEILKGNVNLGSLRLRQDYLLSQGMVPPFQQQWGGCGLGSVPAFEYLAQVTPGADPVEMALARVRQLSAHEVGHTLGFPHNYMSSTYGRASVMDYPAPLVKITPDGRLDLSDAYDVGIGEYDKIAVRWLYSDFPPGTDENQALDAIVEEALERAMIFITDADARPAGAAHPYAALWDNGSDPVAHLEHEIEVRRIGLAGFGVEAVRPGEPLAYLEEVLVPLYLHHRYQLESAAHSIGGANYSFAMRGDGQTPIAIVPGDQQRKALEVVLSTISPEFLAIPERILSLIPPRAYRMGQGETFAKRTDPTFDPLGAAASAAELTVSFILHPHRMARLVEYHSRNRAYPGLEEVVDRLMEASWKAPAPGDAYLIEIQKTAQRVVLDGLMTQAGSRDNIPQARAILTEKVLDLAGWLESIDSPDAHQKLAIEDIRRWQNRPEGTTPPSKPAELPPGMPIGQSSYSFRK